MPTKKQKQETTATPMLWKDFYTLCHGDRAYFARVINVDQPTMRAYESRWYPDGSRRIIDSRKPTEVDEYIRRAVEIVRRDGVTFVSYYRAKTIVKAQKEFNIHRRAFRELWD